MGKQTIQKANTAIMENESDALDWALCDLSSELYWWTAFFNIVFFKTQPVEMPVISFEKKSVKNLGRYVRERNGFGLKETININRCHLDHPLWEILSTLLHEMCHSWQNQYGKPSSSWFHNKEFKIKMSEIGVVPNDKGRHIWVADPFVFFLEKHGVKFSYPRNSEGIIKVPKKTNLKANQSSRNGDASAARPLGSAKKSFSLNALCVRENSY